MPQSQPHNLALGSSGERQAAEYLQRKGFTIIELNFRTKFGEIDVIAQDKEVLVFVEVRTRESDKIMDPVESISSQKIGKVKLAIITYLQEKNYDQDYRIDVISILPNSITHYENVTM